jgi:hypothetical protein
MITAKHVAQREGFATTRERIEKQRAQFLRKNPQSRLKSGSLVDIRPVTARVDFGRWIADCECGGAEYVDPEHTFFFCQSCGNQAFGGQLRSVIFPDEETRAQIEVALTAREVDDSFGKDEIQRAMQAKPKIRGLARSWNPDESVSDLKKQNRKAGLK